MGPKQLQGRVFVRNICNWQITTPLLRSPLGKTVCRSDPEQTMICLAYYRSTFAINWPDSTTVTVVEFWKLTPQSSNQREIFWIASCGSTQVSDSLQRAPNNPSWTKPGLFFRASFEVRGRSSSMSYLEETHSPKTTISSLERATNKEPQRLNQNLALWPSSNQRLRVRCAL